MIIVHYVTHVIVFRNGKGNFQTYFVELTSQLDKIITSDIKESEIATFNVTWFL